MTRVDLLRQALERFSERLSLIMEVSPVDGDDLRVEYLASIGLRILEGDEQLVEQVAAEISDGRWANDSSPAIARAVLAAITEEEQK